ncbi:MAG: PP0621 family protein [Gammaproteobacteria bacterium]
MLFRVLVALVVVIALVALVRGLREPRARRAATLEDKAVRCEHCQVYLPRKEAIVRGGHTYCSREHADEAAS